jgi:HAD superfamily hydrolase (TIGR01509 family)
MIDRPIKAIFFDNDGLLVDTEGIYFRATQEVFATVGVEITKDWYVRENLGKGRRTNDLLEAQGVSKLEIERVRKQRDQLYTELLRELVRPIEGVADVLQRLHGHMALGVVTSSYRWNLDIVMDRTGFRKFFDFVITADDVTDVKPNPEPYLKAVALSGQSREFCLALEDSFKGVKAAKAAGIMCFAIPDALTREHNFSIADKVLTSIREVPALVGL